MNTAIATLERLARTNRELSTREGNSPYGLDSMRLYYLGKAQAYEIAADAIRSKH